MPPSINASAPSRTKAFICNVFWSFALQVATLAVGFLVPRAIIACYGSEVNGLVVSLTQFVTYISLVEAGISSAAIFALYKPLAENDLNRVSVIVSAARKFYYASGWIFVALIACLAFFYPLLVDSGEMNRYQVFVLVLSLGSMGFMDFFTLAKYRVLLTASQRNWVVQIGSIIYKILYAVIVIVLAYQKYPIELVYVAAIAPIVLRSVVLSIYTRSKFPSVSFNADARSYKLEQRWDAFVLQVLGVVQSGFPILVATFITEDLALVSVFSVYLLVATGLQNLYSVMTNGTQAAFGDVIARNDTQTLKKTYSEMGTLVGLVNSAASGTAIIMITPFVFLYTSDIADINYVMPVLGILMVANVFLYHLKTPEGLLVVAGGKYRESRPYVMIQTIVLIVGATVGGFLGGLEGIVIGSCLSNVYAALYLLFFVPARITKTKVRSTLRKFAVTIVAFAPSVLVASAQFVQIRSWGAWIGVCAIVAGASMAYSMGVFMLLERSSTRALIQRIFKAIKAKA